MDLPKIGDIIYVDSHLYIDHGEDDCIGGKATISAVTISKRLPLEHINSIMVQIEEHPGTEYNWKILMEDQENLKKRFGNRWAYPDPERVWYCSDHFYEDCEKIRQRSEEKEKLCSFVDSESL